MPGDVFRPNNPTKRFRDLALSQDANPKAAWEDAIWVGLGSKRVGPHIVDQTREMLELMAAQPSTLFANTFRGVDLGMRSDTDVETWVPDLANQEIRHTFWPLRTYAPHLAAKPVQARKSVFAVLEFVDRKGSRLPPRLLVNKRKVDGKLHAIGGKVEPGETELQALYREISEEIGLSAFTDYELYGLDKFTRLAEYDDGSRWSESYFHCRVEPDAALRALKDEYTYATSPSFPYRKAEVTDPCRVMMRLAQLWQLENHH